MLDPFSISKLPKRRVYGGILMTITIDDDVPHFRYALVQGKQTGIWSFPKGHAEEDELPYTCALREIREETNLSDMPLPVGAFQVGHGIYYVFLITELPLIPQDPKEIGQTRWASLQDMQHMDLNVDVRIWFKAAMAAEQSAKALQSANALQSAKKPMLLTDKSVFHPSPAFCPASIECSTSRPTKSTERMIS